MIPQVGVRKAAYGAYAPLLTADKLALVVIIITIIITIIIITIVTIIITFTTNKLALVGGIIIDT